MSFFSESKLPYRFFFFSLLVLLSFSGPIFAQKNNSSMNEIAHLLEADNFLRRGVFRNTEEITKIAKTLPFENRQMIFNHYAEEVTTPFWMNAVAGFGLGSFLQKNYIHAGIQATGDTIFTILIISSLSSVLRQKDSLEGIRQDYYAYQEPSTSSTTTSSGITPVQTSAVRNETLAREHLNRAEEDYHDAIGRLATSTVLWALFRVYQCVTPILFTRSYNKKLAESLGIYDFDANISPSISSNGSLDMTFSVALKL